MGHDVGGADWRKHAVEDLIAFAKGSIRDDGGFAWLDAEGSPDPSEPLHLWINARMTYVFSLAHKMGMPDCLTAARHGVDALARLFHDDASGGWFSQVDADGRPMTDTKSTYDHAFVLLAASAAQAAGVDGAAALLDDATDVATHHVWDQANGRCFEEFDAGWTPLHGYRGANSNMYSAEAFLAVADVTGQSVWRDRAVSICERIVNIHARAHNWRVPEHYDNDWTPLPDFGAGLRHDPFRPHGVTPGHAFEWSRLLVCIAAGEQDPHPWLMEAAEALFTTAARDSANDNVAGIGYTTDWSGAPIAGERFHWVVAEAALAADSLHRYTGQSPYAGLATRWWSDIDEFFIDREHGSWHHELSAALEPSATTWRGKPDAYHAFNALTLPDLPLSPTAVLTIGRAA
jgi:sulfoquinovose isomerase